MTTLNTQEVLEALTDTVGDVTVFNALCGALSDALLGLDSDVYDRVAAVQTAAEMAGLVEPYSVDPFVLAAERRRDAAAAGEPAKRALTFGPIQFTATPSPALGDLFFGESFRSIHLPSATVDIVERIDDAPEGDSADSIRVWAVDSDGETAEVDCDCCDDEPALEVTAAHTEVDKHVFYHVDLGYVMVRQWQSANGDPVFDIAHRPNRLSPWSVPVDSGEQLHHDWWRWTLDRNLGLFDVEIRDGKVKADWRPDGDEWELGLERVDD